MTHKNCDGCAAGMPLVGYLHVDPETGVPHMGCTADRYEPIPGAPVLEHGGPVKDRPPVTLTATHIVAADWVGKDGVRRQMQLASDDKNALGLHFVTHFDGPDLPPTVTAVYLSPEAAAVFMTAALRFNLNHDDYRCLAAEEIQP